jgi:phosphate transport system protein
VSPQVAERKALSEGLQELNENITTMAELSQLAIRKAVDSLQRMSAEEAKEVFALDREIYSLQQVVEKTCVDLIALHAPVAKDLRTITTCLKITTDLDRIGRYAKDIAEITIELEGESPTPLKKLHKLSRSADLTIHMVDRAIRSFVERDAQSARDLGQFDDAVDLLYEEILAELVQALGHQSIKADVGVRYILVNRVLERIADHAVNIADRVVYMVTGEAPPRPMALPRLEGNGTRAAGGSGARSRHAN